MEIGRLNSLILFLILMSNLFLAMVIVFKEKRDIGSTWAWLMVLLSMPVIGLLAYMFLGRQLKQKNFYNLSAEEKNSLEFSVDEQVKKFKCNQFYGNHLLRKYSKLLLMNLNSSHALLTTDNEIKIFSTGEEKFSAFFKDIRDAKTEINIQYYIIQRDSLAIKLRDKLTEKAKEGVKVRILYDAIGSRNMSPSFFDELISHGGEVATFFPSFLKVVNFRVNNRNHRKICIVDGEVAYIGGFNFGDEYLGTDKKYWRDTHLRVKGESVNHIQTSFILDWRKAKNDQNLNNGKFSFRTEKHTGDSPVQIIASGPNSEMEHLKNVYIKLILSAKQSVYIQSPFFIPDASLMDACKIALLAGVDMRIMIPSRGHNPFVYWASWAYAGELISYGAKILLYEKGFLHAKTIVVDQEVSSVGTTNFDIRSFKLNFEVNAIVYDKKVAKQLHHLFNEDSQVSSEITLERYRERSVFIKCNEAVSRLFSPIL